MKVRLYKLFQFVRLAYINNGYVKNLQSISDSIVYLTYKWDC